MQTCLRCLKKDNLMEEENDVQKVLIEDIRTFQLGSTENDIACPNCNYYGKMAITSIPDETLEGCLAAILFIGCIILLISWGFGGSNIDFLYNLSKINPIFIAIVIIGYVVIGVRKQLRHPTIKCPKCRADLNLIQQNKE